MTFPLIGKHGDLTGRSFSRWLVVGEPRAVSRPHGARRLWLCRCDCGTERYIEEGVLLNSGSRSCGCLHKEISAATARRTMTKHGATVGHSMSPEYRCWALMRARCSNPKAPHYDRYGGRGIRVCERWSTFENFLADMGTKPSPKHSIDRRDNNGNYEPTNCRWATKAEQSRNQERTRFLEFRGERLSVSEWSERLGIKSRALRHRIDSYGWSVERALTEPLRVWPSRLSHNGVMQTALELAAEIECEALT